MAGSEFELLTPKLRVDKQLQKQVLGKLSVKLEKKLIAFATGAGDHASGKLGFQIALVGSSTDRQIAANVAGQMGLADTLMLAGEINLKETGCLLDTCAAVVSNDSGLMHLAAGLGVVTLGIFGLTSTDKHFPLGERSSVVAPEIPGPIEQTTVGQVIAKVTQGLERSVLIRNQP